MVNGNKEQGNREEKDFALYTRIYLLYYFFIEIIKYSCKFAPFYYKL